MKGNSPYIINSISEAHRIFSLPKPTHPLVSVFDFKDMKYNQEVLSGNYVLNYYCVSLKKGIMGKLKYGQNYYDFDEGILSFFSPNQVFANQSEAVRPEGICLMFHPDFIQNYPLARTIKDYGFFTYAVHEALHLSEKEEQMVVAIIQNIQQEYHAPIDTFSQDVIVAQIELLLTYSNRFYNRQFITRKKAGGDLLTTFEALLADYIDHGKSQELGLPTVQYFADQLHLSPNYLSDMLRQLTGRNAQQHIHHRLIEKAKEILTTTSLSVSEVAYQLGFGYPQSFSKLFKNKTNLSPLEFRQQFN